jgi:hypothetical protein
MDDAIAFLRYVALSGREGEQWVQEFDLRVRPLVEMCRCTVKGLRRGMTHEQAAELLQRTREGLEALDAQGADPSLRAAAERWYYGALGFYFYSLRNFDQADDSMNRAHESVTRAVDRHRCLMGLAYDCFEFELHRARIARDGCRWEAMRRHAEESAGMRSGTRPFCVLSDGTPIALGDLRRFYTSLPELTDEDRVALVRVIDDEQGPREATRFVRTMFRLSGFVIDYV